MRVRTTPLIPILTLVAALIAPAALAGGGTVVKLDGKASIERQGKRVKVAESTPVYSGDLLEVYDKGSAQVRFEDDSIFVVPGVAKLKVEKFAMAAGGAGGEAIYTLVDGGLRTMTGKVSKNPSDKYELRSEEGTITVAGSAYMALRCMDACAKKYKKGLYVRGEAGVITVTNAGGQIKFGRNDTVYAADNATAGVKVKVSPFDDPLLSANYNIDLDFDAEAHPPRIEPELSASPS